MKMLEFLKYLKENNIDLRVHGENLELGFDGEISPDIVSQIKERKTEIIAFLSSVMVSEEELKGIPKAEEKPSYELSPSQFRLWILSKLEQANAAYNMQGSYEFKGALNTQALTEALQQLIERHEILRTVFKEDEQGNPRQFIKELEQINFSVEHLDVSAENDQIGVVSDLARKDSETGFDLSVGPLLRVKLIKIADDQYHLLFVMHHIISDGWSMQIMINEVMALYHHCDTNTPHSLVPLNIQFKDFSEWQIKEFSGEKLKAHQQYWLDQFAGNVPVLNLPGDFVRPIVKTYSGAKTNTKFNREISEGIKKLSQNKGGTLFMGLVATVNVSCIN
ncbi:MAG: hypothetical protein JKY54_11000 [Flavobacteriales bacterium]|nr:hypothetical protein [Flavobacteriales bacterium]